MVLIQMASHEDTTGSQGDVPRFTPEEMALFKEVMEKTPWGRYRLKQPGYQLKSPSGFQGDDPRTDARAEAYARKKQDSLVDEHWPRDKYGFRVAELTGSNLRYFMLRQAESYRKF